MKMIARYLAEKGAKISVSHFPTLKYVEVLM
jgi:hypothetical protein